MDEDMEKIVNEIRPLAQTLSDLWKQEYKIIEPLVLDTINKESKDIWIIEHDLDFLLNIPTDESFELFKKLCIYYDSIDKEAADEYKKIWYEMWEDVTLEEYENMWKDSYEYKKVKIKN